jgi:hypothetical protein
VTIRKKFKRVIEDTRNSEKNGWVDRRGVDVMIKKIFVEKKLTLPASLCKNCIITQVFKNSVEFFSPKNNKNRLNYSSKHRSLGPMLRSLFSPISGDFVLF